MAMSFVVHCCFPDRDETTDKYLFENINNIVCIVHNYTNSAVISYYPMKTNGEYE